VTPLLEGIGYYEMVDKIGVNGASFAGGAEIVIFGQGMSHSPTLISAIFSNKEMGSNQGSNPNPCKYQDLLICISAFH
jgi:fatty acid/phospholipid biosynthesis enzyme